MPKKGRTDMTATEAAPAGALSIDLFLQDLDRQGIILGAGPTGTELPPGADKGDYPALGKHNIALTDSGALRNVHLGYFEAGTVLGEAYTWANLHDERQKVDKDVLVGVVRAERQAVQDAANESYARTGIPRYVVDTVRPVGDCYKPTPGPDVLGDDDLARLHSEQADIFAEAGSQAVLLQTFPSIREIKAAVSAFKGKNIRIVGISAYAVLGEDGVVRLPGGEPLAEVAKIASENGALIGINCVTPDAGAAAVEQLIDQTEGDLRLYVGLNGLPKEYVGKSDEELAEIAAQPSSREILAGAYRCIVAAVQHARTARRVGAVLASCCFTGPHTTAWLAGLVGRQDVPAAGELTRSSTGSVPA